MDKEVEDRVNVVAEFGDLLHYWNDMFRLGDASITSLMSFFEIDAPANESTIARINEAAAALDHAQASDTMLVLNVLKPLKQGRAPFRRLALVVVAYTAGPAVAN